MLKTIFSMISAIAAYLFFRTFIPVAGFSGFMLSFLIGLAVLIIVRRTLSRIFSKKDDHDEIVDEKSAPLPEQAKKVYDSGTKALIRMRNKTRMIRNNDAARKIQNICKVGMEIFEDIKKNPSDLRKIRTFTNYYLESTEKIINRYIELSNRKDRTREIEESMQKVESVLDQIKATFDKQLASLLEDDLLDLDVELKVLKKTMTYEG